MKELEDNVLPVQRQKGGWQECLLAQPKEEQKRQRRLETWAAAAAVLFRGPVLHKMPVTRLKLQSSVIRCSTGGKVLVLFCDSSDNVPGRPPARASSLLPDSSSATRRHG